MLKRNFFVFSLLTILIVSFLIFIQCSDKSTNSQGPGNVGMDLQLTTSVLLQHVSQLHIVITGDDMDTIEVTIPLSEEDGYIFSESIVVPSGADRLFVVEVLDINMVVLYRGETTATVGDGVNLELPILLEPQVSLMKLNPRFNQKTENSLLNLTFEVFNIEELYEIFYKVYFRSHLIEFVSATIDTSINEAASFSVNVVHPVTMEPSYLDIVLKGSNNIHIVDENGNGSLVNFVFRCLDISIPVESTYINLSYTSMFDPTGFPPTTDPPLMMDSSLVKIVTDITTNDTIPAIPVLQLPINNATDVILSPILQWNASDHAQLYNLVIATDISFTDMFVLPQYLDSTSYLAADLSDNTTYFWQVRALNETGISEWSEIWSFTTLDNTPPAQITDLLISDTSATTATLTWTAPGDNINSGTATRYDMRFANDISTITNWDSATQATNEPTPQIASSAETMTITGLERENWYYFGIRTTDDAGNISPISNIDSIFLSSGFTIVPTGFSIDYGVMGANWKADWDTKVISFRWSLTGIGIPDGFKIYARDNRINTDFIEVADVLYQEFANPQTGTVTLPTLFDSHTGDGLQTPFSDSTIIEFNIRAYMLANGLNDWGTQPVFIGDETPPQFRIDQIYGDGDNTFNEVSRGFIISLDRQLEYCLKNSNPTFTFIENGGDESYRLPESSVNWFWDIDGRKDDTAYILVPAGQCGAGDLLVVTIQDNSNNAFSDTLNILPNITITGPTSSITTFKAPFKLISWTFANPTGTNYTNTLDFFLSLDGGITFIDTIRNFAYDTDSPRSYVLNDNWMSTNARVGLQNDGGGNIWWSETLQLNGIELVHPTIAEIDWYEVIFDRGNTDSTLIPMEWNFVGIDSFIIWYSVDSGYNWIAFDTIGNSQSYDLYLPNRGWHYECNIAVSDADSDNRPISKLDYTFYVTHDTLYPVTPESGAWIYAGQQQSVEWNYSGFSSNNIILQYSTDKGENWKHIASTPNDGDYLWDIPAYESSLINELQIRFRDSNNLNTLGVLTGLTLVGLKLEFPNGGETLYVGSGEYISFSTADPYASEVVDAYISTSNWNDSVHVGSGSGWGGWTWTVPNLISPNARMRIWGGNAYDESDASFTIEAGR